MDHTTMLSNMAPATLSAEESHVGVGKAKDKSAPVWQAKIDEQWKNEKCRVRLPQNDLRKPKKQDQSPKDAKTTEQTEPLIPLQNIHTSVTQTFTSPSSSQPSSSTTPSTPNLGFSPIQPVPSHLFSSPNTPQLLIESSARHYLDIKPRRGPFSRGTRGKGDPRNAAMREARMRHCAELQNQRQAELAQPASRSHNLTSANSSTSRNRFHHLTHLNQAPEENMVAHAFAQGSLTRNLQPEPEQNLQFNNNGPNFRYSASSRGRSNNISNRFISQGPRGRVYNQNQQSGATIRREDDWTNWIELSIKVYNLPASISTLDLWKAFSKEGSISMIKVFEDGKGKRDGKASIRFSPPPRKAFWQATWYPVVIKGVENHVVRMELELPRRLYSIPSPSNPQNKYPELMVMKAQSLDFGFMYDQTSMMSMCKVFPTPQCEIQFRQNMRHQEMVVLFQVKIQDPRTIQEGKQTPQPGKYDRTESLRFNIPFSQLQVVHKVHNEEDKMSIVISLETPPRFFRKLDEAKTHEENGVYWNQSDAWYRQTDIIYAPGLLKSSPLTLKKTLPVIDIGRWTTYRFLFDSPKKNQPRVDQMFNAFRDHNIEVKEFPDFRIITKREPAIWEYIDKPITKQRKTDNVLDELMIEDSAPALAFPVRYQLEVCISHGYLNEHNMSKEFVSKLINMEHSKAQDVLEYVANQKKRIYDPMDIFDMFVPSSSDLKPRIPHYCAHTRSATITPSTIYYNTPTVETSNRVIRQYSEYADRFLRVRFSDEKFEGRIQPTDKDTMNEVFTRIKRAMINGVAVGDRHYEFLAFGNSQFREHGAYFIAPLPHFTAERIRGWMGLFDKIRNVALHASRIGQCFSTTRAISGSRAMIVEIEDIERNGFCFTDGVGKISMFLAQLAASELGIEQGAIGPPSVFQFRLGGSKGVLAFSPDAKMREIHIRKSQYKFAAKHEGLEIIRWSQFAAASLNRQLILILSALGVPNDIFINKLKMQLSNLEQAMTDEKIALALLQKDIDANQMTLTIAGMIVEGFMACREPFVTSLLRLWRAWSIKYLKEKARILVSDGALLLGCVDETGRLRGHFDGESGPKDTAASSSEEKPLPEIFVQLSKGPEDRPWVVKGPMVLARNPSLHPGDIRVVRGVDIPELYHLKDVVVFPQTGDRDIPSMCSGGDLDGDDFLVLWDQDLLSHNWNHKPMDYKAPSRGKLNRRVTTDDITSFFVTYMKNDTLPTIAHAHIAQADFAEDSVMDEKCLKLAALHSTAVDFVKSGQAAQMPRELKPRKWPHFMEKKHKSPDQIYHSKKILGKLYDRVERVDFIPTFEAPFDERILRAYRLDTGILEDAAYLKSEYDAAMQRIMAQHQIKTEFEVWSTFVLHHAQERGDFKFHEVVGELSSTLKARFREACYEKAGGKAFEQIGPFVAAMYTVTAEQLAQALEECKQTQIVGGQETPLRKLVPANMPLISFPWLFQGVLGKLANGLPQLSLEETPDDMTAASGEKRRIPPKRSRPQQDSSSREDDLITADGITRRGEVLELFESLIDYEPDTEHTLSETKSRPISSTSFDKSVDDMFFGSSTMELTDYEKNGVLEGRPSEASLDNPPDTPVEAEGSPVPLESGGFKADGVSRTPESQSIQSNPLDEQWVPLREDGENRNSKKSPDELGGVQAATETRASTSGSPNSPFSVVGSPTEPEVEGEGVASDLEEEEIVHLDPSPSTLERLAEFAED